MAARQLSATENETMTNHRPLSSTEGDEYRFALKPERTTAAVPLETKYMLICSGCGVLYDGDNERACAATGESPGRGEHITPRYPEPNAKGPDCPNCMGEGGDCPMCEGSGKIGGALDVERGLKDSEVVDPCPNCSAPVFLLDGVGTVREYDSAGPHTCPVSAYTDADTLRALRDIRDHGAPSGDSDLGDYLFEAGYVDRHLDKAARDGTPPWWLLQMGGHHLANLERRTTTDLDAARRECGASPGGQPRSGRKSLTDLCDYIAEDLEDEGAGALVLFGRPNSMDYSLDCTDEASASERHVQGVRLWQLLDPEERRGFLNEWSAARKVILVEDVYERVHTLRCALHETSILGMNVHHEHPGYTEISAPWMRLPGKHADGHGWICIIANPDTLNGEPQEVCFSLVTSQSDQIPGPAVKVRAWTRDVEENARLWREAVMLSIGAVLRGVAVLMGGGDSTAAEEAMDGYPSQVDPPMIG